MYKFWEQEIKKELKELVSNWSFDERNELLYLFILFFFLIKFWNKKNTSLAFRIVIGIKIVNIAHSESSFNLQIADFTYKLWVIFEQFCLLASRTSLYSVPTFINCQWQNTPRKYIKSNLVLKSIKKKEIETWEKTLGFIIK